MIYEACILCTEWLPGSSGRGHMFEYVGNPFISCLGQKYLGSKVRPNTNSLGAPSEFYRYRINRWSPQTHWPHDIDTSIGYWSAGNSAGSASVRS